MKLLQVGCFAAASVQAQDYEGSAQVDYTLDETRGDYEYEYDQFGNKKKKKKKNQASYQQPSYQQPSYQAPVYSAPSYNYDQYDSYGKAYSTTTYHAYALNCWPANFDTDKLVYNGTNTDPYERYATGPLHYYGSENKGLKGGVDAASPAAGDNNRGGLYHYGWENDESTNTDYTENAAPSEWVHYHSARHAGCLYEMAKFDYSADTYDHVYNAYYYNGYFNQDYSGTAMRAVVDTNINYVPNWVHFFNAHLQVGGKISENTAPEMGGNGYDAADETTYPPNAKLVIANPQYEGLGYLNFIATYKVDGKDTGDHYQEFIDMTERTQNPGTSGTTYNTINSATTQFEDGIGGEWFFDGWMGTWTVDLTTATWKSTLSSGTWAAKFAISSFPHNELGKDFRFNLRILHAVGTYESYYWYQVNEITITFPHAVSYALHNDYKRGLTFNAAGSVKDVNNNDVQYQLMNVVNAEERINIIPPLDLGTWDDVNFFRQDDWVRTTTDLGKANRIQGWLDTVASTKASWCTGSDHADENFCATKFKISGLMNTYDEHFAAQMGNIQEIWIQLSYAMQDVTNTLTYSAADKDYVVESPFPYLHFHATEITSIAATCSTANVYNGNDCDAYTTDLRHKGDGPYSG